MTQPQQPFGEGVKKRIEFVVAGRFEPSFSPPLREQCETVDAAELVRGYERRIAALEATVAELRARLDDHLNRQAL